MRTGVMADRARRHTRSVAWALASLLALMALAGCANGDDDSFPGFSAPETAVAYEVEITGAPDERVEALLE
ncbi:MAG: hypothetical protein AAGC57_13620, partial [Pseudomonadota bacterium]